MSSATNAMAHQQKQTTTTTTHKTSFWDDFYNAAQGISAGARAVNGIVDATNDVWKMYDEYKVRDAYNEMSKAYSEGGMEALQGNPDFQDYHHAQALGRIMKDRAASEKGQLEIRQNAMKLAEQNYLDTRAALLPGLEAYKNGDIEGFNKSMVNASKISNLPYIVEPLGDGTYRLMFRSSEEGRFVDTGRRLSMDEVNQIGQEYLRGESVILRGAGMKLSPINERQMLYNARSYMAASDANTQYHAIENHVPLYNANRQYMGNAIKTVNIKDGSMEPLYQIFSPNGQPMGTFTGTEIAQRGWFAGKSPMAAGKTGRGGGGGGRSGGGGESATGQTGSTPNGGFGISATDNKIFADVATDKETKEVDYTTLGGLQNLRGKYGIPATQLAGHYQQAVRAALSGGIAPEKARSAALSMLDQQYARHMAAKSGMNTQPAQQGNGQEVTQAKENPVNARIREAAKKEPSPAQTPGHDSGANSDPADVNLIWQNTATGRKPYITTKSGAVEISEEEANEIIARQKAAPSVLEKAWKNKRPPTKRVTYADVENELSAEEKETFRKTGKLPARYRQVR